MLSTPSKFLAGELRLSQLSPSSFYDHPSAVSFPKLEEATVDSTLDFKKRTVSWLTEPPIQTRRVKRVATFPQRPCIDIELRRRSSSQFSWNLASGHWPLSPDTDMRLKAQCSSGVIKANKSHIYCIYVRDVIEYI